MVPNSVAITIIVCTYQITNDNQYAPALPDEAVTFVKDHVLRTDWRKGGGSVSAVETQEVILLRPSDYVKWKAHESSRDPLISLVCRTFDNSAKRLAKSGFTYVRRKDYLRHLRIDTDDFKGSYILLHFAAPKVVLGSGFDVANLPIHGAVGLELFTVQSAAQRFENRGLVVITIHPRSQKRKDLIGSKTTSSDLSYEWIHRQTPESVIKTRNWFHIADESSGARSLSEQLGVKWFPQSFLLAPSGKCISLGPAVRAQNLIPHLEQILDSESQDSGSEKEFQDAESVAIREALLCFYERDFAAASAALDAVASRWPDGRGVNLRKRILKEIRSQQASCKMANELLAKAQRRLAAGKRHEAIKILLSIISKYPQCDAAQAARDALNQNIEK